MQAGCGLMLSFLPELGSCKRDQDNSAKALAPAAPTAFLMDLEALGQQWDPREPSLGLGAGVCLWSSSPPRVAWSRPPSELPICVPCELGQPHAALGPAPLFPFVLFLGPSHQKW